MIEAGQFYVWPPCMPAKTVLGVGDENFKCAIWGNCKCGCTEASKDEESTLR